MNSHLLNDFYVIAVMTNPERYKTRPRLFKEFIERMKRDSAQLFIVEGAFGDREFEVTESGNPRHIQLRTSSEIWHKENLVNIGISRLPANWKYVAWIDGDITFCRPDWMLETVHELQHHPIVQMFETAMDMGPNHEVMTVFKSFGYCYKHNLPRVASSNPKPIVPDQPIDVANDSGTVEPVSLYSMGKTSPGTYWHPGYAWAATREAIDTLGGLLEFAILGAGDHHMACCLIGEGSKSIAKGLHPHYTTMVLSWEKRAARLHKNIGYVKGTICHSWHGKKANRKYKERWQILIDDQFDPYSDVHKDWQGLLSLHTSNIGLRDNIRLYFQERNEDSIDK